jgi:glc operon protein GlcG
MSKVRSQTIITHEAALEVLAVAITEGAKLGVAISATVVEPSTNLIAFARADGATPHSAETSRRKANTSASTRRATGWMPAELALALPMGTGNLITNVRGGVPLAFEGVFGGGLGIAGGTPDQDAVIAVATLAAVGADPVA